MDDFKRWKITDRKEVYASPWISVHHNDVIAPTGAETIYGSIHFKNMAIGILPIDETGHTWIVGQARFCFDAFTWELPQGGGARDVPAIETARRELSEECNLAAEHFIPLYEGVQVSNCVSDELAHAFIAYGLSERPGQLDDTEELTVRRLPISEVFDMIDRGEIKDMFTITMMARACQLAVMGRLPDHIARHFRF